MNLEDVRPERVRMSMRNNFPQEINDSARWQYSLTDSEIQISGYVNGEELTHSTPRSVGHGDTFTRNGVNEAIARATKFFKQAFAESQTIEEPEPVVVEETVIEEPPKEEVKPKRGGRKKKKDEPETLEVPNLEVD